jgi:hypothetical protein
LREQEAKDELYEKMRLPHGRANFAQEEANFLMTAEKPALSIYDKVDELRRAKKLEKWEWISKELEAYHVLLDNPEVGYEEYAH